MYLSIQIEKKIKKKNLSAHKSKVSTTSIAIPQQTLDKGKGIAQDSRSKPQEQVKSSNAIRTREITCFKCQGRGHYARECPNARIMILTPSGYESQKEDEAEEVEYADEGESLVTMRALNSQPTLEEPPLQRENLFHTRCTILDKVCHLIIDSGSCANIASELLVEKLGFVTTKHPRPYKLKWLNDDEELNMSKQVEIPFSVGNYKDQILCDVAPMQAGHILLGRLWQYDREVTHHGRTNQYTFSHQNRKVILAPLDQTEVRKMQAKEKKKAKAKGEVSLSNSKSSLICLMEPNLHLVLPRQAEACFVDNKDITVDVHEEPTD